MRLSETAKIYGGVNPKQPKSAFGPKEPDSLPWVMVENLDDGAVSGIRRYLTPEGARSVRIAPAHTVFFSSTGTVGKVGMAAEAMAPSSNVIAVEFRSDLVYPPYGMYCLAAMRKTFEDAAQDAVYSSLRLKTFREIRIPVPDMAWQRRAAGQIDRLRESLHLQRRAVEYMKAAAQEFFEEQFGEALKAAADGRTGLPLESVAELKLNGALKKRGNEGIPARYVATPVLKEWEIPRDETPQAQVEEQAAARCRLQGGDIVMNRINQENRVGQCGLLLEPFEEEAVFAQNTVLIRAYPDQVCPQFLFAWLNHPAVKRRLRDSAKRSTSFQCTLSRQALSQLCVPQVPLEDQRRFAERYEKYFAYVRNGEKLCRVLEDQRQVWYWRILRHLQEAELQESAGPERTDADGALPAYWEKRYWTAPSGEVFFYDPYLECFQVPRSAAASIPLSRLPEEVEFQFLDPVRGAEHPQYGRLSHCRLCRQGQSWKLVYLQAVEYRTRGGAQAEQLEQEGMVGERQDFGFIRYAVPVQSVRADMSAEELLRCQVEQSDGYSRFVRLPAEAKRFIRQLSPFQQAVYEEFLLAMQPLTCHMVEQQLRLRAQGAQWADRGLPDISTAVRLLEHSGLLEFWQGRNLEYIQEDGSEQLRRQVLDHRGRPVGIGTWLWAAPERTEDETDPG